MNSKMEMEAEDRNSGRNTEVFDGETVGNGEDQGEREKVR